MLYMMKYPFNNNYTLDIQYTCINNSTYFIEVIIYIHKVYKKTAKIPDKHDTYHYTSLLFI